MQENTDIQLWTVGVTQTMRAKIAAMNIGQRGEFLKMLRHSYKYRYGLIDRIGWKVPRYAIMVEKGLGRGVGMKDGVRFDKSKSGKAMQNRREKRWFSEVMDAELPRLADIIARERANGLVKQIKV